MSPPPLTFRGSPARVVLNFLYGLGMGVPLLSLLCILIALLTHQAPPPMFLWGFGALTLLLSALWAFYLDNLTVEVTAEKVTALRFGRPHWSASRSCVFASHLQVFSINLIPIRRTRYLLIDDGLKVERRRLDSLSSGSYDALLAQLTAPPSSSALESTVRYELPKHAIVSRSLKFALIGTVLMGLLGGLFIGGILYNAEHYADKVDPSKTPIYLGMSLGMVVLSAAAFFLQWHKYRTRIPEMITVDGDAFVIDRDRIPLTDLEQLYATPPDYEGVHERRMSLVTRHGKRHLLLGQSPREGGRASACVFADYDRLCTQLRRLLGSRLVFKH